ncbi:MAG TPA: acyltransferase [Methylophilus sp.]|uniref:acyltransferase family protein n=1 Tax=Methylophilus sp. TaxID=29541 RepID=UPI002D04F007|nr:acyltransferase [Methylophilus sp.]HSH88038.1 acyltransferase [Methylophilus sp.]
MKYTPELDGIRALSILLVMISHAGLGHIVPGGFGVTIFFFISGYLITSLLIAEADKHQHIDLKKFYIRRFWRLLPPAIYFIGISSLLIVYINGGINYNEILAALFYSANYYKIFIHFTNVDGLLSPFNILWSLAIEEHFYILFAPLLAITYRSKLYFRIIVLFLVLPLLIRLGYALIFPELLHEGGYTYSATEARIDSIAFGCFMAYILQKSSSKEKFNKLVLKTSYFVFGAGLIVISLLFRDMFFRETIRYSLQNIGLFLMLSNVLFNQAGFYAYLRKFLSLPVLTFTGKLSYSLYLQHWFSLTLVSYVLGVNKFSLEWQLSFWCLSLLTTLFSYYIIEQPTLALRRKYGSNV